MDRLKDIQIKGYKLNTVIKMQGSVRLELINVRLGRKIRISFDGVVFETFKPPVGGVVEDFSITESLGVKVLTTLRAQRKNTNNYVQLYIRMKDSTDEMKREIIAGCSNLKIKESIVPS